MFPIIPALASFAFQMPLGKTTIMTPHPRNMQAIYATQFKDFELGETRNESFKPL
jgi:hypothetical protein